DGATVAQLGGFLDAVPDRDPGLPAAHAHRRDKAVGCGAGVSIEPEPAAMAAPIAHRAANRRTPKSTGQTTRRPPRTPARTSAPCACSPTTLATGRACLPLREHTSKLA